MKGYNILFFLTLFILSCQSATKTDSISKKFAKVPVYQIVNNDLMIVLDSFILNEKQYDYYDTSVVFYANTMNKNGTVLQFSSGGKYEGIPVVDELYLDSTFGVFYHKSHFFLLYGRSIVCSDLMQKTDKIFVVCAIKDVENGSLGFQDDTYFPTTWIYIFKDGKLYNTYKQEMIDHR